MWMRIEGNLLGHRKIQMLHRHLSRHVTDGHVTQSDVIGKIVTLWLNVLNQCADGSLDGWSHDEVAIMGGWDGEPSVFVDALVKCGLLDERDGVLCIHDWEEYAEKLKARTRKRDERERKKAKNDARAAHDSAQCHVTNRDSHTMSRDVTESHARRDVTGRDETRQDLNSKPLSLTDVNDPAPASVGSDVKLAQQQTPTEQAPTTEPKPPDKPPDKLPPLTAKTREVVDYYLQRLKTHREAQGRWNGKLPTMTSEHKGWKAVTKAIKAGNTVEELCEAIDGMFLTMHNIGKNDQGQEYLGIHIAVRDTNVERFKANAQAPPTGPHRDYKLGWHPGSPASEFIDGEMTL